MVSHQPDELPRTQQQYTIPGILHYIQHEWARFEMERAHWEVERAELQVSLVSLAGDSDRLVHVGNDCSLGSVGPERKTDVFIDALPMTLGFSLIHRQLKQVF